MPLTLKQGNLTEVSRPSLCAGRKCGEVAQALLWSWLQEEPECPSRVLLDKVAERQIAIAVSLRHVNRWRATWGMNRRKGRPGHAQGRLAVAGGAEVVRVVPQVAFVGGHLLAHWLDQQHTFEPVVAQLQQAIETYKQGIQTMTLSCCITASRRYVAAFKRCFSRPCWVSSASAGLIPTNIRLQRSLGGAITVQRWGSFWGNLNV